MKNKIGRNGGRYGGGLPAGWMPSRNKRIFNDIAKFINPASARQSGVAKQLAVRGYEDIIRLGGGAGALAGCRQNPVGRMVVETFGKSRRDRIKVGGL